MVEVEMMLKLNKHLFLSKPKAVVTLPNDGWETHIPNRPRAEEALVGTNEDDIEDDDTKVPINDVDVDKVQKENEEEEKEEASVRASACKDTEDEDVSLYDSNDSMVIEAMPKDKWQNTTATMESDTQTSTIAVCNEQETCDMSHTYARMNPSTFFLRKK
jgi:hypothetical protein